uniref:Uncharacterized protein n=1 Tax=viral metagenome TaxID=1070528 RepID=A0A6M3KM01_9ZZZZ
MSEAKHTKLEIYEEFAGLAQIDGKTIFVVMPTLIENTDDLVLRKANTEELLRRWNNHDDLVAACEYTRSLLASGIGQSTHALAMIEAVLTKINKDHGDGSR